MKDMLAGTLRKIRVELENIGCIKHLELELEPGLNIIKAPNASGKTSLIRGFASSFSSQIHPAHILNLGAVNGKVKIEFDGKVYERRFVRTPNGSVRAYGEMLPFLSLIHI